jgi:hypothetical protein
MFMAGQVVTKADQGRKPKIAIGFFGVSRSLKWTLPSIQENIIQPARQLGEVRLFAHLYQQAHIFNPRSGENDPLDPEEYRLLECDEVRLEQPGLCLEEARYEWVLSHGDAFHDGGKSLANLIHQLHSLKVLGQMIDAWEPDVVVLARPDLEYHDDFGPVISDHLNLRPENLSLPEWQWYGGYNDRLAICGAEAHKTYTRRLDLVPAYLERTGGPLPAERFLKFSLHENGIRPRPVSIRGNRVRANGITVNENFTSASIGKLVRRQCNFYFSRIKRFF